MAEYIACRNCDSANCKGCNIYTLAMMLYGGKFDCIVGDGHSINPTVDVAPVVRCKDCKKASIRKYSFNGEVYSVQCNIRSLYMNEYDFCSYGERKDR